MNKSKPRSEMVTTLNNWYEFGKGKAIINSLFPELDNAIRDNYTVPQYLNEPNVAGLYKFIFCNSDLKRTGYIGESGNVYFRFLEHIYNLFENKTSWGVPPQYFENGDLKIEWHILEHESDQQNRKNKEILYIEREQPFLQYAFNHGCINSELRKKRAEEIFNLTSSI